MAPQPPLAARHFVVVGESLKLELNNQKLFTDYFGNKQEQLVYIDDVNSLNTEPDDQPPFDVKQTLFIIKHFDFDPNNPCKQVQITQTKTGGDAPPIQPNCFNNNNNNNNNINNNLNHNHNNNHLVNPQLSRVIEMDSEVESLGYTTDHDDIDDDLSTPARHHQQQVESDYDGGHAFNLLISRDCCTMGPIALLQNIRQLKSSNDHIRMIPSERPLHNLAMQNTLITFSGIASKCEAQQLLTLTRYMGAKSREDVNDKTTHLVAGNPRGVKYRRALELGLFIMSPQWVRESYRLAQSDIDFEANMPEIVQHYKLRPFHGLHIAFLGFQDDEQKELCDLTIANEGLIVDSNSNTCSHIVIDAISGFEDSNSELISGISQTSNAHVVYREWFWASLEMEGKANEDAYGVPGFKQHPRRSSRAPRASLGGGHNSFGNVLSPMLDYSRSPDSMACNGDKHSLRAPSDGNLLIKEKPDLSQITQRHRACLELLQTERNYVRILETIVNLFKLPLENPDTNDPILPATDVKIIFGNLTPIYDVHKKMLCELETLIEDNWKETNPIGKVFVKRSVELLKAYPPFVNFFEDTKKTINTCDARYPRFHAFIKRCQSKIECHRESLTEMLIRPVQRLPSISLLISELIKRTDKSNDDKESLMQAQEIIRDVMKLINEDKRKTEGQIAMFDIVHNIEDCPPNLLSALRRFVCKAEARLLFMNSESEVIPSKSHKVVLFLFSDLIEICKIRSLKRSHSSRGPRNYAPMKGALNTNQASKFSNKKEHRHLDELRLCDIKHVYKNWKSPEMNEGLVIQARPSARYDQNFRYYPFIIEDDNITKSTFIEKLEECLREDPEQIIEYQPEDLPPISNDEVDFGYANLLVNSMEKSRLSRVLSFRQVLLSPSTKMPRNLLNQY